MYIIVLDYQLQGHGLGLRITEEYVHSANLTKHAVQTTISLPFALEN